MSAHTCMCAWRRAHASDPVTAVKVRAIVFVPLNSCHVSATFINLSFLKEAGRGNRLESSSTLIYRTETDVCVKRLLAGLRSGEHVG